MTSSVSEQAAEETLLLCRHEAVLAGFAITLGSALIAHFAVGDGPQAWSFAAGTLVLWALSYFFWRRLSAGAAERHPASARVPQAA